MVNKGFTNTFNFFVDTINSLQEVSNRRTYNTKSFETDSLKRIEDSIAFIHKKSPTFDSDLKSLRNELVEIRKDATKLTTFFATNPASFRSVSLVDNLILDLDLELTNRARLEADKKDRNFIFNIDGVGKSTTDKDPKTPKSEKVKIFQSAFAKTVEDQMNDFLSKNNISIIRTMQNTDGGNICITIFYREK
jgi:hypothetical protein